MDNGKPFQVGDWVLDPHYRGRTRVGRITKIDEARDTWIGWLLTLDQTQVIAELPYPPMFMETRMQPLVPTDEEILAWTTARLSR